jgi:hypothetical protein
METYSILCPGYWSQGIATDTTKDKARATTNLKVRFNTSIFSSTTFLFF